MSGSTVPGALAALLAIMNTTKPAGADVIYGEPTGNEDGTFGCTAWNGEPDELAVEFTDKRGDAGNSQGRESYDVHNEISVWIGDLDIVQAIDAAFDWYDAIVAGVAADQTLGIDALESARVSAGGLIPAAAGGAVATLRFTVHVNAWRRP